MRNITNRLILVIGFIFISVQIYGQVVPVGIPELDDYYRRLQLLGRLDDDISFIQRPLTIDALKRRDVFDPDSSLTTSQSMHYNFDGTGMIQFMPVTMEYQYTSSYPYGWNDGSMIPNVGSQLRFRAGVFARYKFVSIQFQPEFVTASNKTYEGFNGQTDLSWQLWYDFANRIDMPTRFGTHSYTRVLPGQSSIRLNFSPVSVGLSTENLWWGPGMRSSLLMSNTAPGFLHVTLNTVKPIRTGIGSFESQIIGGRLNSSGYPPNLLGAPQDFDKFYKPKPDDWRYISGIVFSYQPKWVPGLFLGFSRSFIVYRGDMGNSIGDWFPLFSPTQKSAFDFNDDSQASVTEDNKKRDQYISLFSRWVMPAAHAEVYFEYGRNDHSYNLRDFIVQPEHTRAYVLGFRKLVPLSSYRGDMLQLGVELTQQERTKTSLLRAGQTWYTHYQVRDGYTNLGQLLGAGGGPGSNVQTAYVSWLKGLKKIGLQVERRVNNNDFYNRATEDIRRNWVDLSLAADGSWDYGNFIFFGRLQYIHGFNYQYNLEEYPGEEWTWKFNHQDHGNFQAYFGASYRF